MSLKLYEINPEIERLIESSTDPETGEVLNDAFQAQLDALLKTKEDKVFGVASLIKNLKGESEMIKTEEDRLKKARQTREKQIGKLREYVAFSIEVGEKFKNPLHSIYWMHNKSVKVECKESELPVEFQKVSIEVDKQGLRKALENGDEITGVSLQESHSVVIK
jgi:hypothetical protein